MKYMNTALQHESLYSYHPMPFFNDIEKGMAFNKKLDLNLYCIKRPQQTCFIRVTNPNMLAWGIETGDMLVVEKNENLFQGDLVVLKIDDQFQIYEVIIANNNEFIFMALDSKKENIKIANWAALPVVGTVTNTIHQMKRRDKMKWAA